MNNTFNVFQGCRFNYSRRLRNFHCEVLCKLLLGYSFLEFDQIIRESILIISHDLFGSRRVGSRGRGGWGLLENIF